MYSTPMPYEYPGEQTFSAKVDRTHEMLSNGILATASWIDSFFYDERFDQEENKTRFKLRTSCFAEEGETIQFQFRADLRLMLPGFEDRLALALSGDDEEEGIGFDAYRNTIQRTDREDSAVSLRYFIKAIERRNISASLGFRWRESRFVTVPELRWRETFTMDQWELRFVQKLKWYSDVGWEEKTAFDLDRLMKKIYLFRTSLDGTWSEAEESDRGYVYNLNFSFRHPLTVNSALIYEYGNNFQTKPRNQLQEVVLKIRYRQRVWRDWLYLEVAPQASFPRERDFDVTPGIMVFVEALIGHYDRR